MKPQDAWDIYFANAMAMLLHPGHKTTDLNIAILRAAAIADNMLITRNKTWQPGSQPEPASSEAS